MFRAHLCSLVGYVSSQQEKAKDKQETFDDTFDDP